MKRRAVGLVIALVVITLVGSAVSLLTLQVTAMTRQRLHDKNRTCAQMLIDSGIAYVQMHQSQLVQTPLTEPIALPVSQILPTTVKAGLTLERLEDSGAIRICTWSGSGHLKVHKERTLALPISVN